MLSKWPYVMLYLDRPRVVTERYLGQWSPFLDVPMKVVEMMGAYDSN